MNKYEFTITASDATKAAFKSVKAGLKGVRAGINSTHLQIGVLAGATGLGALIHSSINAGAELIKMSDTVNASVKELSAWQHAGKEVNIEADKMADIFKDVQDKIGDLAVTGGGGAIDMFETLNLDIKDFIGLSAPDQILKIGEALEGVATKSEKIFFLEALAGDASRLLPLLENNAQGMKDLIKEADELGVSINRLEAEKLRQAEKAISNAGEAVKGVGLKISTKLAPFIVAAADSFTEMALNATEGSDWITDSIDGVSTGLGVMADGLHSIEILWQGAKIAGIGFGAAVVGALKLVMDGVAFFANSIKDLIFDTLRPFVEVGAKIGILGDDVLQAFNRIDSDFTFDTPEVVKTAYTDMVDTLSTENAKLNDLLMQPLPSTGVKEVFEEIKQGAIEAGKAIEENVNKNLSGDGESSDAQAAKHREDLQAKLERIAESHLTELELIAQKEAEELAVIEESKNKQLISHNRFLELKFKAEQKFQKQRDKVKAIKAKKEITVMGELNKNKEKFGKIGAKITKVNALQETISNTHAGAMGAYKALASIPIIGPALGAAAYALVMKTGLKAKKGISAGSLGGGAVSDGGATQGSTRPSIPTPPDLTELKPSQEIAGSQTVINIGNINGLSGEDIAGQLKQFLNDDGILIATDTRNGQELAVGT